jgi:hypothetical protein
MEASRKRHLCDEPAETVVQVVRRMRHRRHDALERVSAIGVQLQQLETILRISFGRNLRKIF